ncbi:MAG: hypothetical protein ACK4UO_11305 [Pseudolabrys sp.]
MRTLLAGLTLIVALGAAAQAAERRMFIIANDAGYGIDRCLASGDKCGAAAANAYCKQHQFAQASTFHKVDRDDITGAIPTGVGGNGGGANTDNLVAIVCTR